MLNPIDSQVYCVEAEIHSLSENEGNVFSEPSFSKNKLKGSGVADAFPLPLLLRCGIIKPTDLDL